MSKYNVILLKFFGFISHLFASNTFFSYAVHKQEKAVVYSIVDA